MGTVAERMTGVEVPSVESPTWLERVRADQGAILWMVVVVVVYVGATALLRLGDTIPQSGPPLDARGLPDRGMQLAINIVNGRWDLAPLPAEYDVVVRDGLLFQAISPLPIAPYLLFVPFQALWAVAPRLVPMAVGIIAAWLALPLARRYGPEGNRPYWIAAFAAFGTLVFTQSVVGNIYYLAHVEAVACCFVALIEWRGRRRPWLIGLALALGSLARPTILLAVIPFGIALVWRGRTGRRIDGRAWLAFALPIVAALVVTGLYDLVRFGSPFETGYGTARINDVLAARRDLGVFSLRHVPDNLALLVAGGFGFQPGFPWLRPDPNGHSLLLTSPALLIAVGAGFRDRSLWPLYGSAALIAVPVLTYYGFGGWSTYGYRYALDFIPFLIPLMAIAIRRQFGPLEQSLIALSVLFVGYGFVWAMFRPW